MNDNQFKAIANKSGPICALVFKYIFYWVQENEKNNKVSTHFHDGRYWMYNSVKDFSEYLTYLTVRQIRTSLETLKENGLIVTGNFNNSCNRTLWYTITQKAIDIMNNQEEKVEDFSNSDEECITIQSENASESSLEEQNIQKCQNDLSPVSKPFVTQGKTICHTGQNHLSQMANGTNNKPQNINSNNIEKEIYKEKEPPERQIFNFWNSKRLLKATELNNYLTAVIFNLLKSFTLEQILLSITRYEEVIHSQHYYDHDFTLRKFLVWQNIQSFLDDGDNWSNYVKWKAKNNGSVANNFIHNNYTAEQIASCVLDLDEVEV